MEITSLLFLLITPVNIIRLEMYKNQEKVLEMKIRQMERILTQGLKEKFVQTPPQKYDTIYIFKRPAQSSRLKKKWNKLYRPKNITRDLSPPLQPEIDMIFCKGNQIMAVEIKYFEIKGNSLSRSFYEGIEQTLALLRWGFDYVALWQLFEARIKEELWFYGGWTWKFVHAPPELGGISLPIEYTMMQVQKTENGYDFRPVQPERDNGGLRLKLLRPPYDPAFEVGWRHPNPIKNSPQVQRNRSILTEWLKTQRLDS